MVEIRSYSIDELDELTGFNQRTISYYIQQGLLPKVGRRGRSTRYPQLFVDRLKFIQRVRELQDSGRLGSVTLPRIARVIWYLVERSGDTQEFPELDDRELQRLFDDEAIPDERVLGETREGDPVFASFGKFGPFVRAGEATASIEAQEFNSITLEDALSRISEKQAEKEKRLIKEFEDKGIQVLDGPYGPYVRHRGVNAKIPKNLDPTRLTIENCESLIEEKRDKLAEKKASSRRDKLSARVKRPPRIETIASDAAELSQLVMMDEPVSLAEESLGPSQQTEVRALADDAMRSQPTPDRLIQEIEWQARQARSGAEGRTATWTRAPITENIEISVQGVDPEQAELVDALAQRIRKLLGVDHD
jgi:hypothetical protein